MDHAARRSRTPRPARSTASGSTPVSMPCAVQESHERLGRDVARRPGRERAPAEAGGGRVEGADAGLEAGGDVLERPAARVVQVERDPLERDALGDRRHDLRHLLRAGRRRSCRRSRSRRTPALRAPRRPGPRPPGATAPVVGAAERGRDVPARPHPGRQRPLEHGRERGERLGDGHVHVRAREPLRGGREDGDRVGARGHRPLEAAQVRHEHGVAHAFAGGGRPAAPGRRPPAAEPPSARRTTSPRRRAGRRRPGARRSAPCRPRARSRPRSGARRAARPRRP